MNPRLIKVSRTLAINPAHVAFAEWDGEALRLHFITSEPGWADGPAKQSIRVLTGNEAKRCWAALLGGWVDEDGKTWAPAAGGM